MQLKFEHLAYQKDAISAIVNLFQGEPNHTQSFELTANGGSPIVANRLDLTHGEIQKNLKAVQNRFRQPETQLGQYGLNFTVEMETGTGKTYVYLRTIFELNQQYGWRKFVIVVPSVAIREGVLQSIRATKTHFETEFNKPIVHADIYRSERLNALRHFAQSSHIEILGSGLKSMLK